MKLVFTTVWLAAALSVRAQTVATTANVLHPLTKDPNNRNGISSVNQDPSVAADYANPRGGSAQAARPAAAPGVIYIQPAKPAEIVARVDATLSASPVSILGTLSGIKGKFYVTNIGSLTVTPFAQFAVCNQKGFQIGTSAKTGQPLAPNESERIEVLATNLNAVDLKLMKLAPDDSKK